MTELWLVRHGETDWNIEKRFQGQTDVPLNANGRLQARELAVQLDGIHFDAIFSSDLSRARETAEILAARVLLPVQLDPRLREIRHGAWEGQTLDPDKSVEMRSLYADPLDAHAPGGETLSQVAARTRLALDKIASSYPDQRVLVVAHGVSLGVILCQAEGLSLSLAGQNRPENCVARIVTWVFQNQGT